MIKLKNKEIINMLLDKNNTDDIIMNDNYGMEVIFEQVATIPYYDKYTDKEDIYTILHPKNDTKEFNSQYVYPFLVVKEGNNYTLVAVDDESMIEELDKIYNNL